MLRAAGIGHVSPRDGCSDRTVQRKIEIARHRRDTMLNKSMIVNATIAVAALASVSLAAAPADAAAVYCKTAGVPQGCIVRPTAPVYVAPVARPIAAPIARPIYGPTTVKHVGYTRVTPYGVKHVGYTRVRR